MPFQDQLEQMKHNIDAQLKAVLANRRPDCLYEPIRYVIEAGGKRLRPFLVQLCCQAVGGREEGSFQAALAVELLHTFTLVHDDIMDHDDLRRGRPTVHKQWDEPTAILAGDGLVTLAYQTMLKTSHPALTDVLRVFTDGLLLLCEGQALDKAFESRDMISLAEYEDMIEKKTAKLIEVSCEMGAILGNAASDEQQAIRLFAHHLGRAFQIQDDLLDLLSDSAILGKPTGSDFIERKKTYLTIHFENHSSSNQKNELSNILNTEPLEQTGIDRIRVLLQESGTIEATLAAIRQDVNLALEQLNGLPANQATDHLKLLAKLIESRVS